MRNYKGEVEAAYMASQRQGNTVRDVARERSSHEDRQNRHRDFEPGFGRSGPGTTEWHTVDSYRPVANDYLQALDGSHRGKGPKNYKRSDERIREIVCDRLCEHPGLDASAIEVEVRDSDVILLGEVKTKSDKRLAEGLAESVSGVANVENRIHLAPPQQTISPRNW
ncbi:MAG TPA: BON domain-containing protein [Chryseosolibacter sp.]|nr:BON domain-containing protein [Chryseosolibacter sp.]